MSASLSRQALKRVVVQGAAGLRTNARCVSVVRTQARGFSQVGLSKNATAALSQYSVKWV